MTLSDIETAVRKNFAIDAKAERFLVTHKNYERCPFYIHNPLIVFIGIATLHEFKREDIIAHLKIINSKYAAYWATFAAAYNESILAETRGGTRKDHNTDHYAQLFWKYHLVCKTLNCRTFWGISIG